ncbi:hypothetical protein DWW52_10375 [Odoribacter sp. AF15-53]|nr:hypothetical protein DWW52_10375 [Odoribacter sp. AF15-53]
MARLNVIETRLSVSMVASIPRLFPSMYSELLICLGLNASSVSALVSLLLHSLTASMIRKDWRYENRRALMNGKQEGSAIMYQKAVYCLPCWKYCNMNITISPRMAIPVSTGVLRSILHSKRATVFMFCRFIIVMF